MTLKEGRTKGSYEVMDIRVEHDLERRLEALGLTAGTTVTVLNNDKKGAMTVKFRGTRFAMGRHIADNVIVKEAYV